MKIPKIFLIALLSVFIGFAASSAVHAEDAMTNEQLVGILINNLGIDLPDNFDNFSDAEQFEVQANLLAAAGLTQFINASINATVTRGDVAEIMYSVLGGSDSLASAQEKIDYVANLDFLSAGAPDETLTVAMVSEALSQPTFMAGLPQAYSPPVTPALTPAQIVRPIIPQRPTPEQPASPI